MSPSRRSYSENNFAMTAARNSHNFEGSSTTGGIQSYKLSMKPVSLWCISFENMGKYTGIITHLPDFFSNMFLKIMRF